MCLEQTLDTLQYYRNRLNVSWIQSNQFPIQPRYQSVHLCRILSGKNEIKRCQNGVRRQPMTAHLPVELCGDVAHMRSRRSKSAAVDRNGMQSPVIAVGTPRGPTVSGWNRIIWVGACEPLGQRRLVEEKCEKTIWGQFGSWHPIDCQSVCDNNNQRKLMFFSR